MLVNVEKPEEIANGLKSVLADGQQWEEYSEKGIIRSKEMYSWDAHAKKYIQLLDSISEKEQKTETGKAPGNTLLKTPVYFISDLDGTLIEGEEAPGLSELVDFLKENNNRVVFGISTGRNVQLTREALSQHPLLSRAEIIICSVGTEIYYTSDFIADKGWEKHINYQWERKKLLEALNDHSALELQEEEAQTPHKLSYYIKGVFGDDQLAELYKMLDDKQLRAKIFVTDNTHLDLVPVRSGKGKALHYLSYKWKKPIQNFIVSGNGGNDIGMLGGRTNGIVVSNHSPELVVLKENSNVYFRKILWRKGYWRVSGIILKTGNIFIKYWRKILIRNKCAVSFGNIKPGIIQQKHFHYKPFLIHSTIWHFFSVLVECNASVFTCPYLVPVCVK